MKQNRGKIVLALPEHRVPPGAKERIEGLCDGRAVEILSQTADLEKIVDEVEIVAGEFPFQLLSRCSNLTWFQLWYAGSDWIQRFPDVKTLPFRITTASGIHGSQMTEHLFGMLLAWYRKFPVAFAAKKNHEWVKFQFSDMDVLAGKTLLIVGYGTIGKHMARLGRAFDMTVIGVRKHPSVRGVNADGDREEGLDSLRALLPLGDIVVNVLPLTPETRGFFDAELLGTLRKDALFVNIGRGGTVDEGALISALQKNTIAGALLDVASEEPLPVTSPLWALENCMLTSHYAGFHPRYDEQALGLFLENLKRYTQGGELKNVVDKTAGY